ncbi:putative polysaccharide biosynthesis protein [Fusibacter sp. JL298sf-3]
MKNKFAKNLGIMGIIGVLIKIIGATYRIPLVHFMSEDAVAYYGLAYPWYTFLITLSSVSVTAAIAKLVAESIALDDKRGQMEVYVVSSWLMRGFGLLSALFLIGGAGVISGMLNEPGTVYSFYVLGIATLFVSFNAVFRGFFQGHQRLEYYANAQLIEQVARVVLGIGAVVIVARLQFGDAQLAGAATSGALFGAFASWLYANYRFKKTIGIQKEKVRDFKGLAKKIIKIAAPVAVGASILPILAIVDSVMVQRILYSIGMGDSAKVLYSYISSYSAPIVNLTQIVFSALSLSLLPMIAESFVQKKTELRHQVGLGVLLSLVLGLPMGLGIATLAEPILMLLYPSKAELMVDASSVLALLGVGTIFLSLYLATTSILQGLNAYKEPVRHLVIGAVIKVVVGFLLIRMPSVNVDGAAISTLLAYMVASLLNLRLVFKLQAPEAEVVKKIGMTLVINVFMAVIAKFSYDFVAGMVVGRKGLVISLFVSIVLAAGFYGAAVLGLKIVTKKDFERL